MLTIAQLRQEIEQIDMTIIEKIAERQALAKQIGQLKLEEGSAIYDSAREEKLFKLYEDLSIYHQLPQAFIKDMFKMIIHQSKKLQLSQKHQGCD